MWQFDPFCDFLEDLVQLPIIDEVIVINNLVELTPDHSALKHPKVQMHKNKVELIAKESHEFYMKCQTETLTKMRS